jgi:hypothetical protein
MPLRLIWRVAGLFKDALQTLELGVAHRYIASVAHPEFKAT